jgi:hypothetical protein
LRTARAALLCGCGLNEVLLIQDPANQSGAGKQLWSWRAQGHEELPAALPGSFGTTDDCQPVEGGARVLLSPLPRGGAIG